MCSDLHERALLGGQFVQHVDGDRRHTHEGHQEAEPLGPRRVLDRVELRLQRHVAHRRKHQDELKHTQCQCTILPLPDRIR